MGLFNEDGIMNEVTSGTSIIVRNTHVAVTNYTLGKSPRLENYFRLYDRVTHTSYHLGMYYNEPNNTLYLPRGMDIWMIEQLLKTKAIVDHGFDTYSMTGDMKLKVGPRDDIQKEALRFMIGTQEYRDNEYKSQLAVNLATGKGKTYLAVATLAFFEMTGIIITYSVQWLKQWKERIVQYTGVSSKEIFFISGAASINRLMSMKDTSKYKIYLVTHSTIKSFSSTYGWESITELFKHLKIGIKFYDEAHLNFLNMSMIDFYTNTYKTYYLTATPARSSEEENIIYGRYFKNIPHIDLFDDEEDPHTKYIAIKFNSQPTVFDISDCKNQYGLDRNKYVDYLVNKPQYYELLRVILDLALRVDGKCLIFIGTNKAIYMTYRWIHANYPELSGDVGIFTTLKSKEEKVYEQDKKIILSTTKSAGAAVDIAGLKMTVVINEPFKSHVTAQQSLGRTRATDTFYIECVDLGFSPIKRYYTYKKPVFEKYATECSEILLKPMELTAKANQILDTRLQTMKKPFISFVEKKQFVTFGNSHRD